MPQLKRSLGAIGLSFYGVGLILGAGVYTILGEAGGVAREGLWLSFALAAVVALLTGFSYAELTTMHPRAGAEYVYLREAFPKLAWLPGTMGYVLAASAMATAAAVAVAFGGYFQGFAPVPVLVAAAALVAVMTALNAFGLREASWANIVMTLIEVGGLVLFAGLGFLRPVDAVGLSPTLHAGVFAGAGLVFFAYLGFEEMANMAEEAREPSRTLPRAIFWSLGISTVLYVLVAWAAIRLADPETLAASASPLVDVVRPVAPRLAGAMGGIALFATANTCLLSLVAGSRLLYGMARDKDAPGALAVVSKRRHTPWAATLAVGAGALLLVPVGGAGEIGAVASFTALLAFASVHAALLQLRRTRPDAERPFRVPFGRYALPAVVGLVATLALATQLPPTAYLIGGGAVVLSAVVAVFRARGRP